MNIKLNCAFGHMLQDLSMHLSYLAKRHYQKEKLLQMMREVRKVLRRGRCNMQCVKCFSHNFRFNKMSAATVYHPCITRKYFKERT